MTPALTLLEQKLAAALTAIIVEELREQLPLCHTDPPAPTLRLVESPTPAGERIKQNVQEARMAMTATRVIRVAR